MSTPQINQVIIKFASVSSKPHGKVVLLKPVPTQLIKHGDIKVYLPSTFTPMVVEGPLLDTKGERQTPTQPQIFQSIMVTCLQDTSAIVQQSL